MNKDFSIFENVLTNENQITEAFSNFLHYQLFRDIFFAKFLPDINSRFVADDDICTQIRIKNFQPDLIIRNEKFELFFEIKVGDATLQDTQVSDYFNYLNKLTKQFQLCYILPKQYHELNRIEKYIEGKKNTKIIFWEEIIELINEKELHKVSSIFNEFLKFLKYWFEPKKISFTKKQLDIMFSKEIPTILLEIFDTIEQIKKELSIRQDITISKAKTSNEHGFYIRDVEGNRLFFFGVWYEQWIDSKAPFVISVHVNDTQNKYIEAFNFLFNKHVDFQNWKYYSFKREVLDEDFIKYVVEKLNELIDKQLR